MLQPFIGSKLLIQRSLQHLSELKSWHSAYLSADPIKTIKEYNIESGKTHHKIKIVHPLPEFMSAIAFDMINCLRSALDHAVYDATVMITGEPAPQNTKFPFGNEKSNCINRAKFVPSELLEYIVENHKPYRPQSGGDETLVGLNDLRNQKIHRLLAPFVFNAGGTGITEFYGTAGSVIFTSQWNKAKQECTYAISENPDLGHYQINVVLDVCFDQVTFFENVPFMEVLIKIQQKVCDVVEGIEVRTKYLRSRQPPFVGK